MSVKWAAAVCGIADGSDPYKSSTTTEIIRSRAISAAPTSINKSLTNRTYPKLNPICQTNLRDFPPSE
jgi:hypothetical protein